jgi:E3 ubiquitin-protein ligase BRE1
MKRSGASALSDSGGLGLSQSGNHFISTSLSASGTGPLPKKSKYLSYYGIAEDFCGFSDEPSVHLNAVKMMNTELFCKSRQLSENINALQSKIQSSSKKEESLKEKWKMIQSKGQSIFQEMSSKIQNELPNKDGKALEAAQKSNLIQCAALQVRDLKSLTDEQRTFFDKFRNSIFNKTSDEVLSKNLSFRKEESVLFHAHSQLAAQIEDFRNQFVSLEEESRAYNVIQDEIKQIKEKIEILKKVHSGLNIEQDMEETKSDTESISNGNGEAFETSRTKNEISIYQSVSKSKEDSKNSVKNQLSLLQRQLPKQPTLKLTDEMIRDSLAFKSVDSKALSYTLEAEAWGHEGHAIMTELMELDRQRGFDKDLMGKLDQMHIRAKDEKVTFLEQRAKHLKKEKEQLQEKFDLKKKEVEEKDLVRLIAQLAEIESKVEKGKQIIDQKENEKAIITRQLEVAETEKGSPTKSVNESLNQFIRKLSNVYDLIIEEMKSIQIELQEIKKKRNIAENEEKEIVLLINRQKSKVSLQYVKKAELLAREKTLLTQVKSLQQIYQETIARQPNSAQNQILSTKLAQMLSSDKFTTTTTTEGSQNKSENLSAKRDEMKAKVTQLKNKVEDTIASNEEMQEEINEVHSEFLSVLNENIKQMKELAEYEENNLKLVAQCTKQHQINGLLKRKLEILTDKIAKFEQKAQAQDELLKKYSKKLKTSENQVAQATQELDLLKPLADGNDVVKESGIHLLTELKRRYEELLNEIESAKGLVDPNILIEKEKAQQQKLKDEIYVLNQKIDFTTKHKLEESKEGDDEVLTYYKKLINCPACQERPKNFVITRCYHLFCQECIESYSECPTCFKAYNDRDMKQIFI